MWFGDGGWDGGMVKMRFGDESGSGKKLRWDVGKRDAVAAGQSNFREKSLSIDSCFERLVQCKF